MRKLVVVIAVLLGAAGCSTNNSHYKNISGREVLEELDTRIITAFDKPMDGIINEYGKPDRFDTLAVVNKHTGGSDDIYTLLYDDYDLSLYYSVEIDKFLLQSILFKSDDILKEYNISFGMSESDVDFLAPYKVKSFEKSDHVEIVYSVGAETGYESLFVFYFKDNSLDQVKYNAPID
jgi:hypothetical protein